MTEIRGENGSASRKSIPTTTLVIPSGPLGYSRAAFDVSRNGARACGTASDRARESTSRSSCIRQPAVLVEEISLLGPL